MVEDLPYQVQPQVKQLLAERANADALGLVDRVAAVDKQLSQFGYSSGKKAKAAAARAEAVKDDEESSEPKGRSTRKQQTTDES